MNTDIINTIVTNHDIKAISVMELLKITMEIVEKIENKASGEKKLIVISILEEIINIDNDNPLSVRLKNLIDNGFISHIIEAFVFASKYKININLKKINKCCFIC